MEDNNITTTNEEQEINSQSDQDMELESAAIDDVDADEDFEKMYEESIKEVKVGGVVKGRIIQINPDDVVVDVGYKSEGHVPRNQFLDADGSFNLKVDDEVDVFLEKYEDEHGNIQLSRIKAERLKVWDEIKSIYDEERSIQGKITGKVKGGLSVDIGVPAFLPGSQIDLKPVRNLDKLIGETFDFKVLKHNQKRNNVVVSRRALLEKERESMKTVLLDKLHEGAILDGTVKNITDYGAFIDLGGLDGLLHITDISWGRVNHPSERLTVGDEVKVKVIKYDEEKQRVSLGMKQLKEDPWATAAEKYPVDTKLTGKVISIKDYGAFVEIEEGIESLVHVSEMSWTKKIKHPSQVVNVGDEIEAVVLSVDPEKRRISLGMKQVEPNPWDSLMDKYPIGTKIEGEIKNITDFGIFVGIENDIDGLVHISDISWSKRLKHPNEEFSKGQTIQAVVLNLDKENQRFSLGIKQLQEDPWETISKKIVAGDSVTGTVTNLTDFGAFVELEDGVEGLVHVSEITADKGKKPEEVLQVGTQVTAKVLSINYEDRKIALSIKDHLEDKEKIETGEYMSESFQKGKVCLGEILQQATNSAAPSEDSQEETDSDSAE
ncbi:MAG: 30S ribosomal protein S1 [Deltaproteobacteria bacterium]|nr:30S ribosomal protein S1 [Candidatus Anaeroferrophillus wilburensis]MBN2889361.1 30S ribosomal protein S1 [Deltaproteobacteria bacterium]